MPIGIDRTAPMIVAAMAICTLSTMPVSRSSQRPKSGGTIRARIFQARGRPARMRAVSTLSVESDQTR